jgi:tetratricopeptide (TPR) repeat protein
MMFRIYHVRFGGVFRPLVGKCHRRGRRPIKVTIKELDMIAILTFVLSPLMMAAAPVSQAGPAPRFDLIVRADFFAGFAGDSVRLVEGMEACERVLAANPNHAEALVWHGSGLAFGAGMAFRKGDMTTGAELWERGLEEMERAVRLEPDNVGVRIPRGAMLLQATRAMPPEMGRGLLEKALGDYEHVLALQSTYFTTLGDHPKGELLFGLAEGYSRLGNGEKARGYFERLIADAPASGQAPKARTWLATGALPKREGLGCVGCHK